MKATKSNISRPTPSETKIVVSERLSKEPFKSLFPEKLEEANRLISKLSPEALERLRHA